jgi:glutaredoxin-like YruB-family protein
MKNVIIYSTSSCFYCRIAKDWFKENNIDFTEYDVSADIEKRDEMIKKTGQMAVPVIMIDEEIVIGFDKKKLSQLLLV